MDESNDVQPTADGGADQAQASAAQAQSNQVTEHARTVERLGLHPATPAGDLQDPPVPPELQNVPRVVKVDSVGRKFWAAVESDSKKALGALEAALAAFKKATGYVVHTVRIPRSHMAEIVNGQSGLPVPTQERLAAGPLKHTVGEHTVTLVEE